MEIRLKPCKIRDQARSIARRNPDPDYVPENGTTQMDRTGHLASNKSTSPVGGANATVPISAVRCTWFIEIYDVNSFFPHFTTSHPL